MQHVVTKGNYNCFHDRLVYEYNQVNPVLLVKKSNNSTAILSRLTSTFPLKFSFHMIVIFHRFVEVLLIKAVSDG